MKKVTVDTTISQDGRKLVAHVQGIKGDGCAKITDALATAHQKLEERDTPERFEHERDVQQVGFVR